MNTALITQDDINYLTQQAKDSSGKMNMIIAGMTALLHDTDNKVEVMEKQNWFQRMCKTISGKNKMTKQEIQKNHDKINLYVTQAMTVLFEQQCVDHGIIISLGNQINEIYAENLYLQDEQLGIKNDINGIRSDINGIKSEQNQLRMEQMQLKQLLGQFVTKLNEKIESVDNFHILQTEIDQDVYSGYPQIVSICKILSQMDNYCVKEHRKMKIIERSMGSHGILDDSEYTLNDYLMRITEIPVEEIGAIYVELASLRNYFVASLILDLIERYHFLSDSERKFKNKQLIVDAVISDAQIEPTIALKITEFFEELVDAKLDAIKNLITVQPGAEQEGAAQTTGTAQTNVTNEKLKEAEALILKYKINDAIDLLEELAEEGNGRAMYHLGNFYWTGRGKIVSDHNKADEFFKKGRDAKDTLAALVAFYRETNDDNRDSINNIIKSLTPEIKALADNDDHVAMYELSRLYKSGRGGEEDINKSLKLAKKSSESGYYEAISFIDRFDREELNWDDDAYLHWLNQLCEKEFPEALYLRARYYSDKHREIPLSFGEEDKVKEKKKEALLRSEFNSCKRAAELNQPEACSDLGDFYSGFGFSLPDIEGDYESAIKYYKKAVQLNAFSKYTDLCKLGEMYINGYGTYKDEYSAFKYYKMATELVDDTDWKDAQLSLAKCYKFGRGTSENTTTAKHWLEKYKNTEYKGNSDNINYNDLKDEFDNIFGIQEKLVREKEREQMRKEREEWENSDEKRQWDNFLNELNEMDEDEANEMLSHIIFNAEEDEVSYQPDKKQQVVDVLKKYKEAVRNSFTFDIGNVSSKKINNAKSTFALQMDSNDVIGFLDTTLLNSGKAGVVFSSDSFYFKSYDNTNWKAAYGAISYCEMIKDISKYTVIHFKDGDIVKMKETLFNAQSMADMLNELSSL